MRVVVPPSPREQGALQGVMGSMTALGSVFGPVMLTQVLAAFTESGAPVYFPGAAFVLAGCLMLVSLIALATVAMIAWPTGGKA